MDAVRLAYGTVRPQSRAHGASPFVDVFAHLFDEAFVELDGGVVPEGFEFLVESGDLDELCEVPAGSDGDLDER